MQLHVATAKKPLQHKNWESKKTRCIQFTHTTEMYCGRLCTKPCAESWIKKTEKKNSQELALQ